MSLNEHRPIVFCSVAYKCLAEISQCIPTIISRKQSAFVGGRSIKDYILLSYELLTTSITLDSRFAAKIDLRKAYDTIRWEAVVFAMH